MDDSRTLYVGNIADEVTEELLYELFLQAGPVERVKIPVDREGRKSNFGFVTFKHESSVPYTVQLLQGTSLYDRTLNIKPRNNGTRGFKESPSAPPNYHKESPSRPNEHIRFDNHEESYGEEQLRYSNFTPPEHFNHYEKDRRHRNNQNRHDYRNNHDRERRDYDNRGRSHNNNRNRNHGKKGQRYY